MVEPLKLDTVVSKRVVAVLQKKLKQQGWMAIWLNEEGDPVFLAPDAMKVLSPDVIKPSIVNHREPNGARAAGARFISFPTADGGVFFWR